ncbi:MAG TPA: hypothetical protein VFO85_16210, partial [Vicinamibacteria bacterium]|nr:hypothetical protein [Vicinamibacteria bacterium]
WRDYPDGRPDRDWGPAGTLDALCASLLRETPAVAAGEREAAHPRLPNGQDGHTGHVPRRGVRSNSGQ